jgi:hypothetical protein
MAEHNGDITRKMRQVKLYVPDTPEADQLVRTLQDGLRRAAGQNNAAISSTSVIISADERAFALTRWRRLNSIRAQVQQELQDLSERYGFKLEDIVMK